MNRNVPSKSLRMLFQVALAMAGIFAAVAPALAQVSAQTVPVRGHEPQVTITGISNQTVPAQAPAVGHVLRAEATAVDPDQDTIEAIEYRWRRGTTELGNAQSYTTTQSDAGQELTLEVTATTDAATTDPFSGTASTTITVAANTAPTAAPTITGELKTGSVLTGSVGYADADGDAEGTHSYQWYRADDAAGTTNRTPISGATAATYTIVSADQGKYLVFEVTPKSATGTPDTGVPTSKVTASAVTGTAPVVRDLSITGRPTVGSTLTANYTYSDADGDAEGASSIVWCRPSVNCNLGAGRTYVVKPEDVGIERIQFRLIPVSATGTPDTGVMGYSPRVTITAEAAPTATAVSIEGTVAVGSVLTGKYTYSDANGDPEGTSTFKWYRADNAAGTTNKTVIAGATAKTYTPVAADRHKYLVFEVTPKSATGIPDTGVPASAVSAQVPGNAPTATSVSIDGTVAVGSVLTGKYTYSDANGDPEGTSTFKWYRADNAAGTTNKTVIAGATAKTYTPVAADRHKYLVFEVTPKSATGIPDTGVPASAVSAQVPGTAPVASNATITGSPIVGSTLTANYIYSDADGDAEGASTITWCRPGVHCNLGTGRTYVVKPDDAGNRIEFEVKPVSATGIPNTGVGVWSNKLDILTRHTFTGSWLFGPDPGWVDLVPMRVSTSAGNASTASKVSFRHCRAINDGGGGITLQ